MTPRTARSMLVAALVWAPIAATVVAPQPAMAAGEMQCRSSIMVLGLAGDGGLWSYQYTSFADSNPTGSGRTQIGAGWHTYGRVLTGPEGRLYGIDPTGLYRYRWAANTWENLGGSQRQQLTTRFTDYATTDFRNWITIDSLGDFYAIDANGQLRRYRYDEPTRTWTIDGQILDTGWSTYNLIVAAGPGVLYARDYNGALYRYRIDPGSQRILVRRQLVGTGWNTFRGNLVSVGGDTLLGVAANGDLLQYRYEEASGGWPVAGRLVGTGWNTYPTLLAFPDSCWADVSMPVRNS